MDKIQAIAGIINYGEDRNYQAYLVTLDFCEDLIDSIEKWDKFFDDVNSDKINMVLVTLEKMK